tara:strand:+ start:595 stop:750 length:156 start_codon:yes stop_codon:yes gene_type:complete
MRHAYFLLKTELDEQTYIEDVVKYVEEDVEMICVDYMMITDDDQLHPWIST